MDIYFRDFSDEVIGPITVLAVDADGYYVAHPEFAYSIKMIPYILVTAKIELEGEIIPFVHDLIINNPEIKSIDFKLLDLISVEH